jgi:hypothetical protein
MTENGGLHAWDKLAQELASPFSPENAHRSSFRNVIFQFLE